MKGSDGHNYFFAVPKTWKENAMALLDAQTQALLDSIIERLDSLESAVSALLEEQEDAEDAIHDEAA